ncbi:hypothetical protein ACT691_06580 [Vibrio metschnikovii]
MWLFLTNKEAWSPTLPYRHCRHSVILASASKSYRRYFIRTKMTSCMRLKTSIIGYPEHANDRVWAISNQEVLQSDLDFQYGLKQLLSKASVEEVNHHLKQLLRSDATIIIGADRQETLSKLTNQRDHIQKTKQRRGIKTEIADINPALYQPIQQGEDY